MLTGVSEVRAKHTKKENYYYKNKLFLTSYKLIIQFQCIIIYVFDFMIYVYYNKDRKKYCCIFNQIYLIFTIERNSL